MTRTNSKDKEKRARSTYHDIGKEKILQNPKPEIFLIQHQETKYSRPKYYEISQISIIPQGDNSVNLRKKLFKFRTKHQPPRREKKVKKIPMNGNFGSGTKPTPNKRFFYLYKCVSLTALAWLRFTSVSP